MLFSLFLLAASVAAVPTTTAHGSGDIASLFRRQDRTYPQADVVPERSTLPQAWLDKLASATIPNIPVATGTGLPTYPGREKNDKEICSFTYECTASDDLHVPPAGVLAITFDDGPAGGSDALWKYLQAQNATGKVTHFMIGSYITRNQDLFKSIAQGGAHIAVHTWSHKYTTTLTNEEIVGELGWAMQIMADLNNGRIPMYWRPPFGDVDNRVRAIAKQVFGLETVIWNQDSSDWRLDQGQGTTVQSITESYRGWLSNRNQGLNVLHHEVRESQIDAFKAIHPALTSGWELKNIADAWSKPWYQNAATGNSTVQSMAVGGSAMSAGSPSSSSASASSAVSSMSSSSAASSPTSSASTASMGPSVSASASRSSVSAAQAAASSVRPSGSAGKVNAPIGGLIALLGGLLVLI